MFFINIASFIFFTNFLKYLLRYHLYLFLVFQIYFSLKNHCYKNHLYYNSKLAQRHYEEKLYDSRSGVDIKPETLEEIESIIVPLIKDKEQSVNQVFNNHPDILYFSKTTFYKYVELGIFSLNNSDLPKKVKYKPRKHKINQEYKRKVSLLIGRKYEDFIEFITLHPEYNVFEADTVIGKNTDRKCLLTLYLVKTHFMFIFLLDKKEVKSVDSKINYLKETLGIKLYSKVFGVGLTDNGTEFTWNQEKMKKLHPLDNLCLKLDIDHHKIRPRTPRHNGKVERSHRNDNERFYNTLKFDSLNDLREKGKKYLKRSNQIPMAVLGYKTPLEKRQELIFSLPDNYNTFISLVNAI